MWHVACMEGADVDAVPADHQTWGDLERIEYCNLFFFPDWILDPCDGIWE
jgi:hypothetical protein